MSYLRELVRGAYLPLVRRMPVVSLALLALRRRDERSEARVRAIYEAQWAEYEAQLDAAPDLATWLRLPGVDDVPASVLDEGRVRFGTLDHVRFLAQALARALDAAFPGARSVAELGSGAGRTLLALERARPDLALVGYELTEAGVRVATRAAERFRSRARFAQLDYARAAPSAWTFGTTDVGVTVYSLGEVPERASEAIAAMLAHVEKGLVLLEASPSHYPRTARGLLARAYARQHGYLRDVEAAARRAGASRVERTPLDTSNNPLLLPSIFVVRK